MKAFSLRETCELCGSSDRAKLCSVPYTNARLWPFLERYYAGKIPRDLVEGAMYEVVSCKACGFIWQAQVLSPEWAERLYEEWIDPAASLAKRERASTAYYIHSAAFTARAKELIGKMPNRVLDFGMGWGHWCMMANAFGLDATGCELSPSRIAYAERHGVKVAKDLAALPDASFRFINADQVFEHVEQPLDLLKALVRTLAPGGYIHIAVPNGASTTSHFASDWNAGKDAWHPLEHINTYTPATLQDLGVRAGLVPVTVLPTTNSRLLELGTKIPPKLSRPFMRTNQYFRKP